MLSRTMRLSELARSSGTSIPTIKYYIREGLLPPGRQQTPRQGEYDESHIARLRLIRALVDVGGLSLTAVRAVLAAMAPAGLSDATGTGTGTGTAGTADAGTAARAADVADVLRATDTAVGIAHAALPPRPAEGPLTQARQAVEWLGWQVDESSSALGQLEAALSAAREVGLPTDRERIEVYGDAALRVAAFDVAGVPREPATDPGATVTSVVLGTVMYEPVLLALRRLAHGHAYRQLVSTPRAARRAAGSVPAPDAGTEPH